MVDQFDIYKILMNNNLIVGSDLCYMFDVDEEDRGFFENVWSVLMVFGDYIWGFLMGDFMVCVIGEELLCWVIGIE